MFCTCLMWRLHMFKYLYVSYKHFYCNKNNSNYIMKTIPAQQDSFIKYIFCYFSFQVFHVPMHQLVVYAVTFRVTAALFPPSSFWSSVTTCFQHARKPLLYWIAGFRKAT